MPDGGRGTAGGKGAEEGPSGAEARIIERILEEGRITFAEFMDIAMFSPEGGYYTSSGGTSGPGSASTWGAEGDYVTNLDISPVFPVMAARQINEMWVHLGSPRKFTLVEPGAGRGWLAKGIMETAGERFPDLYRALRVCLVEKNPHMADPPADNVAWYRDISEVDRFDAGCVVSNELIDSFPVHRVRRTEEGLREIYVGHDGSGFVEVADEASTPELARYLERAGVELAVGQTTEINLAAADWVRTVAGLMDRGFVVTIDYGWPASELYGPDRPRGTLMCHYRHTTNTDPYRNIGRQDITAHVDFSTLARVGEEAGLEVAGFTTQKNFFFGLGITDEAARMETLDSSNLEAIRFNQSIKDLIMPGGPGDIFKVLIQRKGVEDPPKLLGLSFRDMASYL